MNKEHEKNLRDYYMIIKDDEVTETDIRQALELDRKYLKLPDDEQFDIKKCLNWKFFVLGSYYAKKELL